MNPETKGEKTRKISSAASEVTLKRTSSGGVQLSIEQMHLSF